MWRSILRSAAVVGIGVLLGRFAGFVRELVLAYRLGLGREADVAVVTLTLPDVFINVLVGGAIGAVLIPEFKKQQEEAPGRERTLLFHSTVAVFLAFGALAAGLAAAAPWILRLFAPGLSGEAVEQAADLLPYAVTAIPLASISAVGIAYLHSRNRFLVPSMATLVWNGVLVVAILGWVGPERLLPLAVGILVAGTVRWGSIFANAVAVLKHVPRLSEKAGWTVAKPVMIRYAQALGSLGFLLLAPAVARALASLDSPGSLAAVNYAQKLVELPMGIAVGVLSVVLFPRFAELFAAKRVEEGVELLRQGTWLTWVMAFPVAICMAWFSHPFVSLLFGYGKMDPGSVATVSDLATFSLWALPAQGLSVLFFSALSARGDTRRPFLAGAVIFAAYVPAAWAGLEYTGLRGLILSGVGLHWCVALGYAGILVKCHGQRLLSGGLGRDLLVASVAALAGAAPVALWVGRDARPVFGTVMAFAAGALALGLTLALRYKSLPLGLRTFYKGFDKTS